jgi:HEPN domain-containing protein
MELIRELNEAVRSGLDGFKEYLQQKIQQEANFLELFFWTENATQMTVLNYLIHRYNESPTLLDTECSSDELVSMMTYVLSLVDDINIGTPLHQALSEGKTQLALHLLDLINGAVETELEQFVRLPEDLLRKKNTKTQVLFNVDQRDSEGRTLLSMVLDTKNATLLTALLQAQPNIHVPTNRSTLRVPFQPIHQAVVLNYSDGIRLLVEHGARLENPCGATQDTPVLLAAHLCKIEALEALLEHTTPKMLEVERASGKNEGKKAIELFCEQLNKGVDKKAALRGVAMLLCRGAKPPRTEAMRHLLNTNRSALLKEIDKYLEDKPDLVDSFVDRCHQAESALHNIVYAPHSWVNFFRRLFGMPSNAAYAVENLMVRKYTRITEHAPAELPLAAAEPISATTDPLKLYAFFVKRYKEAYDNQLITNSWSTMRLMMAEGQCNWDTVRHYVETNPNSRSAIVYKELFKPMPKIHDEIEVLDENTAFSVPSA